MKFSQLEQIVAFQPRERLVAVRRVSGNEEYLRDHFPRFPVLPGVLMLEALFQGAAWLIYATEGFRHPIVVLKEVRNVKFTDFVEPGETLTVTIEVLEWGDRQVVVRGRGEVGGQSAVSGRLVLERFGSADRFPRRVAVDRLIRRDLEQMYQRLAAPQALRTEDG